MVQSQNRQITILDATHFLGSCEIVARRLTFAVAGFVGILYPVYLEILVQIVIKFPASRRDIFPLEAAQMTVPYHMSGFHSFGELVASCRTDRLELVIIGSSQNFGCITSKGTVLHQQTIEHGSALIVNMSENPSSNRFAQHADANPFSIGRLEIIHLHKRLARIPAKSPAIEQALEDCLLF